MKGQNSIHCININLVKCSPIVIWSDRFIQKKWKVTIQTHQKLKIMSEDN